MRTRRTIKWLFMVWGIMPILFSGCGSAVKVKVEYRKQPVVPGLKEKVVLIGEIQNDATFPQAPRDVESYLANLSRREDFFRQIFPVKDEFPYEHTEEGALPLDQISESPSAIPWQTWNEKYDADYLIVGQVYFHTTDISGYESRWVVNRAGYRVPQRIWVDKISYDYLLRLLFIDLRAGTVALEKEFKVKDDVQGAADEVAVFLDLTEQKTSEFLDILVGKKVRSHRFLLYE